VLFTSRRATVLFMSSLALTLFLIDYTSHWLDSPKRFVTQLLSPLYSLMPMPNLIQQEVDLMAKSKYQLVQDLVFLQNQVQSLKFEQLALTKVSAENDQLRDLLGVVGVQKVLKTNEFQTARLLGLRLTSIQHQMIINKGKADGVVKGSSVLDAHGLVGQVYFVGDQFSWVALITDPEHAVPFTIARTGVRGVAQGIGQLERIRLAYIPETADVKIGDEIFTSGLGGRFPAGYPIGKIADMEQDQNQAFIQLQASPAAMLATLGFVFVVKPLDFHPPDTL